MPVEIRHGGGDIGALAGLALLLGQMQGTRTPQLPRMPSLPSVSGGGGISGGAGGGGGVRRRQPRRKTTRDGSMDEYNRMRLEEQIAHKEAKIAQQREIELMQEKQRLQQEGWKYEYTTKQRHEIGRILAAGQRVRSDPRFDEGDRMQWDWQESQALGGIRQTPIPPDPREPQFAEEQEPGKLWEHEGTGAVMRTTVKDGVPTPEIVLRPDQTMQYKQMELKAAIEEANVEQRIALEKEMRATKTKLATEPIDEYKDGQPTGGKRYRSVGEVNAEMWSIYGDIRQEQQPPPIEVEGELTGGRPEALSPMDAAMAQGMEVTEGDRKLPPNVGAAQAFLRHVRKRYKSPGQMPTDVRIKAMEADRVIREYMQSMGR